MKAIINGRIYDTEKAILVGEYSHLYRSDFSWWEAGLYRTPKLGRYFMAGEGGPMSQFGKRTADNMMGSGEKIIPMEKAEALEWAEQQLTTDEIEKEFADMIEEA